MQLCAAEVAQTFLAVLWDEAPPTIETLARALDRLLAQSHDVAPANGAGDDRDPQPVDGPALYRAVAARFPDLGLYRVADPLGAIDDPPLLGDAIDDLADITQDLQEVVWRDTHLGPEDAAWYFRLLWFHWGRHARDLSLYLHAMLRG